MVNVNNYDEVLTICEEIKNDTIRTTISSRRPYYETKYPEFVERFPFIFDKSCDPDFDFTFLKLMLSKMKTINTKNEEVQEKQTHDASVEVGKELYETFIKHKVKDME